MRVYLARPGDGAAALRAAAAPGHQAVMHMAAFVLLRLRDSQCILSGFPVAAAWLARRSAVLRAAAAPGHQAVMHMAAFVLLRRDSQCILSVSPFPASGAGVYLCSYFLDVPLAHSW